MAAVKHTSLEGPSLSGRGRFAGAWLSHRLGRTRSLVVVVAMWCLGLSAIGGVYLVQQRLDARRQAQVVTADLRLETTALISTAFDSSKGLTRIQVQAELNAAEDQIGRDTARLGRLAASSRDAALITSPAGRLFAVLGRVNVLVSAHKAAASQTLMAEAQAPGGPVDALSATFARLSAEYNREASSAGKFAEVGSMVAIISVLLAFSLAFSRASALARTKHREALTDPLTGLANRRRLFADMEKLLRDPQRRGERLGFGMFDLDGFKLYNDTFGHPAGDALLSRLGHALNTAVEGKGTAYRMGGDEFCVIAYGDDADATLMRAQAALMEQNEHFTVGCSVGSVTIVPSETTLELALSQADQRLYNNKRSSRTRDGGEAHDVLLCVLAENSLSLASHLSNVGRLAEAVARKLGLSSDEVTLTRLTAELHDIGKTAIPDAILDKPGPLDADEWAFMRRHTVIGERILAAAPALTAVAPLVRATHERTDGAGYPDGLRADAIPLSSRIVSVVDAYDAMTSKRPYSVPLTPEQAIAELRRCAGTQFDPAVTTAFIAVWRESRDANGAHAHPAPTSVAA